MGLVEAVVSTLHMVLFSGMDLVLPARRMFHQLCTSAVYKDERDILVTGNILHVAIAVGGEEQ